MLPHKVEPGYNAIVEPYEGANNVVDQPIKHRGTRQINDNDLTSLLNF